MSRLIRLYGRSGCSLCETTESILRRIIASDEQIERVDIDDDPTLSTRLLLEIPAIGYGEALLPLAVDEGAIRAFLAACRSLGDKVDDIAGRTDPSLMTTTAGDRS